MLQFKSVFATSSEASADVVRPSELTEVLVWILSLASDETWWVVGSASLHSMPLLLQGLLKK